jgi:hypothetical protein
MTRSFGDKIGAQAGVIAVPGINNWLIYIDVLEYNLTN